MSKRLPVSLNDILKAHSRIKNQTHKTPVFTNHTFDQKYGRNFYFKAENLQKTGSFKARGALNAVTVLTDSGSPVSGVVTHSSGNHGQALAWAAKMRGLKCAVICPNNSPAVKLEAIQGYGADVVMCEPTPTARQQTCDQVSKEKGYHFIPPYDHLDVIAGQGTIAVEFLEQVPELDAILVPTSGGGMVAGIAIAAKSIKPDIKVFIVEPLGKDVERSLTAGERLWPNPPRFLNTIADGIRLQQLGHVTWPIILELVEKQVFSLVFLNSKVVCEKSMDILLNAAILLYNQSDDKRNEEIIQGMKFCFERMKLVVEAASGAGVAAAMSDKMREMDNSIQHVGVILCGGNTDIDHLPWYDNV